MMTAPCIDSVLPGSFIINMGVTPQTINNGLRPYGLLYDLTMNYKVPIVWSISPTKLKDGADFTHNGITYRGGTFIIPAQFISPTVQSRIAFWEGQGVLGNYAVSSFIAPVSDTITCFPKIMIDNTGNQGLLTNYYSNASIPPAAYNVSNPAGLGNCYDVWTAPHSDPTWATHSYLYNFVTIRKGWVWAGCHTISILESCQNPSFPFNSLKFLTTGYLQCYNANSCNGITAVHAAAPSSPFSYYYPNDPVMQFMGIMDPACQNGSERWVIPLSSSQWYNTSRRGVTTSDGISPREGAEIVYGPAFGNTNYGWAMYSPGHSLAGSGSVADQVAAQRSYFNFILLAGIKTRLNINLSVPSSMTSGTGYGVSANVTTGVAPYSYSWSSNIGGTFSSTTAANPTYTPPYVASDTLVVLQTTVTDNCGRKNTKTACFMLHSSGTLPVELLKFTATPIGRNVILEWSTASEINNDYFRIERSSDGVEFNEIGIVQGNGNSTMTHFYEFTDEAPPTGTAYYRLAQTDYDGTVNYSHPIAVNLKAKAGTIQDFTISSLPISETLSIHFLSGVNSTATIFVYDVLGKICIKEKIIIKAGMNAFTLSGSENLINGPYYVRMEVVNGPIQTGKVIKN